MKQIRSINKLHLAAFVAILFHVCGLIGILFSPYRDWFIRYTPLNLGLMAILLIWNQQQKNKHFWMFIMIAFLTGMGTEMIGVNTGKLFGNYEYGEILGSKWNGVPWLIGINWMILILACGSVMQSLHNYLRDKYTEAGITLSYRVETVSLIVDGAILAMLFDWLMEPVAVQLGFWSWQDQSIPVFNYICWFIISAALLWVYRKLDFNKTNHFAIHLLVIEALFFLTLRLYL